MVYVKCPSKEFKRIVVQSDYTDWIRKHNFSTKLGFQIKFLKGLVYCLSSKENGSSACNPSPPEG